MAQTVAVRLSRLPPDGQQTGKIPGVDDVPNVWITSVLFPVYFMGNCPTLWAEQTL